MKLFTLIFSIVIAGLCFWSSGKLISIYFKVKSWSKIPATVISKKVELHKKVSTSRTPYAVCVEYKYSFNNKDYTNNTVYLVELAGGQSNHMKSDAEKIINEIKDTITIHVDREDPQRSVIFCNGIGMYIFIFFMGILSLLIGIAKYL